MSGRIASTPASATRRFSPRTGGGHALLEAGQADALQGLGHALADFVAGRPRLSGPKATSSNTVALKI